MDDDGGGGGGGGLDALDVDGGGAGGGLDELEALKVDEGGGRLDDLDPRAFAAAKYAAKVSPVAGALIALRKTASMHDIKNESVTIRK